MMAGGVGLLGLLINLILGPLIGAVILRAAVAICNKLLPNEKLTDSPEPSSAGNHQNEAGAVVQASIQETDNPYATPQAIEVVVPAASTVGIPEPAFGKACGICLVAIILNMVSLFSFGVLAGSVGPQSSAFVIVPWVMLAVSLAGLTTVLKLMLPASLARSVMVSAAFVFIAFLLLFLVGLVVASVVFLFQG